MQRRALAVLVTLLLLAGGYFAVTSSTSAQLPEKFTPRSLKNASVAEIGDAAIKYLRNWETLNGPTEIKLVRPITANDLTILGFGTYAQIEPRQQLWLVVLKGNFNLKNFPSPDFGKDSIVEYAGVVFIADTGEVAVMTTSTRGELFRAALNDPTLPSDAP